MLVRFTTSGQMDFNNYEYIIAFNTSPTLGMPYAPFANAAQGYRNFSWVWIVYGANGQLASYPQLCQFYTNTAVSPPVSIFPFQNYQPTQTLLFQYPSNGNYNQFALTFPVTLLNELAPSSSSATPSSSPTPSATTWSMNLFTANTNNGTANPAACVTGTFLDSLGLQGASDQTYSGTLNENITTSFDLVQQLSKPAGSLTPSIAAAAQITGGEWQNNPATPAP